MECCSADGMNWVILPNSGKLIVGLVGDGQTLFASLLAKASPIIPLAASQVCPIFRPQKILRRNSREWSRQYCVTGRATFG
jgi:hypothetical protein